VLIRKDGAECEIEDRAAPMRDGHERVRGAVLVFHEITERRRLERNLRETDRRKDEFLAMLAHELRNPLAPLRGGIDVLRLAPEDPARLEQVSTMMDRQVQHLTRLVEDLLDVSRITRGTIELRRERIILQPVISHALEMVEQLQTTREHEVTLTIPPHPLPLTADATRLSQVFVNLLSNAFKYTPPGGRITVGVELQEGWITTRVADDGVGIPSHELTAIFELFIQGHRSLDRTQGGLGLGLPVATRIVELHGGTLEAFSAGPGQGSEFVVRLPALEKARSTAESLAPVVESPTVAPLALAPAVAVEAISEESAKRRVLIVDDNQDAAAVLGMLMRLWDYEIALAHNGRQALATAAEFRPEIVLLDLGLPELDGYQVARHLREDPHLAHVVLIAVSGYGRPEDRRRTTEAGFDRHLVKPVDLQSLAELLKETLPRSA
jgi:signal transduction histidine kinase/ActR/RegA family two-component response regulator